MSELFTGALGPTKKQGPRKRIESEESQNGSVKFGQPPDGGWGWIIVVASFAAHAIADGCTYSFGVLFVELLDVFGESRAVTAWIGSLFVAMPSVCAPVASALTQRFGCRITTIAGGAIAALGCVMSAFANSIGVLCFTFGVIAGFGLALVFIPAVLIVAFYFEKRRAFATGIAVAGSGIGTFIFAPLTEYLINQYSWRGGLLIIGGLMLNLIVCGALFRPVSIGNDVSNTADINQTAGNSQYELNVLLSESVAAQQAVAVVYGDDTCEFGKVTSVSLVQFPTYFDSMIHIADEDVSREFLSTTPDLLFDLRTFNGSVPTPCPTVPTFSSAHSTRASADNIVALTKKNAGRMHPIVFRRHLLQTYKYNNVFYRGGLLRARLLMTANDQSASCPDIFVHSSVPDTANSSLCYRVRRVVYQALTAAFDLSIFRSVIFILFCIHCFLLYLSYNTPYIYIPGVALGHGIAADKASTLVSVIGVASTFGQIVMGFVGDRPEVNALHFYVVMTAVAGISTLVVPALLSFNLLAVYCALFGFFISANYALTTIILVSLLGIEKLTNAFGVVSMAGGIAILIGPPLAGWIADESGSYDPVFYMAGVLVVVSGLILLTVPVLRRCDPVASSVRNITSSVPSVVERHMSNEKREDDCGTGRYNIALLDGIVHDMTAV